MRIVHEVDGVMQSSAGIGLDTIERAIDHPPSKADHFVTAVSIFGAAMRRRK